MAQIFHTISLVAFGMAGISLVVAIILWFRFGIWNIIGELSGRVAKRSIMQMREKSSKTPQRAYYPAARSAGHLNIIETPAETTANALEEQTTLLQESGETTVLQEEGTTVLEEENTVEMYEETDELTDIGVPSGGTGQTAELQIAEEFEVIENILFIHTEEQI